MTIWFDYRAKVRSVSQPDPKAGGKRVEGRTTYRELLMHRFNVTFELVEVGAVPVQVDVVELAAATARLDHLAEPVEALVLAPTRCDGGECFLSRERVDVLLIPGRRLRGRDAVDVRLVEREDG